jgi:hypothetical protein
MRCSVLSAVLYACVVADVSVDSEIPAKALKTGALAPEDPALQRFVGSLPEVRDVWEQSARGAAESGMPPAEKCNFECAAAGVSTYLGCAGVCAKTLNYTAAVACVVDGCPIVVAAATEACLKKNPICQPKALSREDTAVVSSNDAAPQCTSADMDIWKKSGRDGFEKNMLDCGKKCFGTKACVSKCVQQANQYSQGCSDCFGELGQCTKDHCTLQCLAGETDACKTCTKQHCVDPFKSCSGIEDVPQARVSDRSAVQERGLAAFKERLFRDRGEKLSAAEAGEAATKKCALGCTLGAIGVYWGCALTCVYEKAATQCITAVCPAVVAGSDVGCLKTCKHDAPSDAPVQYV